jgi:hypothetical protein
MSISSQKLLQVLNLVPNQHLGELLDFENQYYTAESTIAKDETLITIKEVERESSFSSNTSYLQ